MRSHFISATTLDTQYQYFGFCSERDCPKMVNPKSIGDAPFSLVPHTGLKMPFIIKTPFVEPLEKEGDIWKGMLALLTKSRKNSRAERAGCSMDRKHISRTSLPKIQNCKSYRNSKS